MKKFINYIFVLGCVAAVIYGFATLATIASDKKTFEKYQLEKVMTTMDKADNVLFILNGGELTNSMKEKATKAKYKAYLTYFYDSVKETL